MTPTGLRENAQATKKAPEGAARTLHPPGLFS